MPVDLFAVTNRGLEPICAAEMKQIPGLQVKEIAYRRVSAELRGSLSGALRLRTVDDIFIDLATWHEIGPHRVVLQTIRENSRKLDLPAAVEVITRFRPLSRQPTFSVTANFVGRRNYTTDEIKTAAAEGVRARYGWRYVDEDQSEINLRIFSEHDTAYIGVRLAASALHRRSYKQAHLPGSLKPSVAAAMLQVAEVQPRQHVLDPFCGAGTIPIEAALHGALAWGGDLDPTALLAAGENAKSAGVRLHLHRWDAARLPLAEQSIDCIVTNLPWGRQVHADEQLAAFYHQVCTELKRVLVPGGRLVLLTSLPALVQLGGMVRREAVEISLFGQNPSILKYTA